jgi:hypothetical protein
MGSWIQMFECPLALVVVGIFLNGFGDCLVALVKNLGTYPAHVGPINIA